MNRLILILLILSVSELSATSFPHRPIAKDFLWFRGGANLSNTIEHDLPEGYDSPIDWGLSYQAFLGFEHFFNPKREFSIMGSVGVISRLNDLGDFMRTDIEGNMLGISHGETEKIYITAIANALYYPIDPIFIKAGIYYANLYDIKSLVDGKVQDELDIALDEHDFGLDLGFGYAFRLHPEIRLSIGYSLQLGLINDNDGNELSHMLDLGLSFGIIEMFRNDNID